jgi:c-di-GMP-binding flagellar brake protein YcgR
MQTQEHTANPESMQMERRRFIRHAVDEECQLLFASSSERVACRLVDLSLGGCLLRAAEPFRATPQARVEISFKVRGVAFRFNGVVLWSDGQRQARVHFQEIPGRRRLEFADLLCEVLAANSAKAGKPAEAAAANTAQAKAAPSAVSALPAAAAQPAASLAPPSRSGPLGPPSAPPPTMAKPAAAPQAGAKPAESAPAAGQPGAPAQAGGRDRRAASRHEVDTSATILLVNIAARLKGRIIDLSLGGCRIRTDERFPVGIYTRIETEFNLEGLPFRLGGVVQAIQGKDVVGIRFLDMSERKKEQLKQLTDELEETLAKNRAAEAVAPVTAPEAPAGEGVSG